MKFKCAWLLLSVLLSVTAVAQTPAPLLQNVLARPQMSLNGEWHYVLDPYDEGVKRRYPLNLSQATAGDTVLEYDFASSPSLHVPGDWNTQYPELLLYEGTVWYQKSFDYRPKPGRRAFLYVGAANYRSHIWLNGKSLCEHEGGYSPFNCEATSLLKDGANFIVISVNNARHTDDIPALRFDWWNYGGLTRDVSVVEVPDSFIEDYSLQLQRGPGNRISGWVRLAGAPGPSRVTLDIPELHIHRELAATNGRATFELEAAGLERWSPEHPKLYDVTLVAGDDRLTDQIGFRTVEVRGTEILLNGVPVFLRGINMHAEAPLHPGRSYGDEDARILLGWARELGCNFVRLAHYPHDEHATRLADRMGLLVWSEIPLWQGITWTAPGVAEKARRQLEEMITRDRNRSSIIFWSITNESAKTPERNAFMHDLAAAARSLDGTRLITAATNQITRPTPHQPITESSPKIVIDDPLIADLDVVGVNEYIGWYEGMPADLERIAWENPFNKPVIISEFGADARHGLHGDASQRWTEEYQEDVYKHQIAALRKVPFIRGISPWILKDFRSPRRQLPFVQDGFNRKGLISNTGERKRAYFMLQQFYREAARETGTAGSR